jgi:oxazoline/thiazoline dehydrogenase
MSGSFFLSLHEEALATSGGAGEWTVHGPQGTVFFQSLSSGILAALCQLQDQGADEDALVACVRRSDGDEALSGFLVHMGRLDANGLLLRSVRADDVCLATLVPLSRPFAFTARAVVVGRSYRISRFAFTRRNGNALSLESPRSRAHIVLHDARAAALVGALAEPGTVAELVGRVGSLSAETVALLLSLLLSNNLLAQEADDDGMQSEDDNPALRTWSFHDLLFHTRSRFGRHADPAGKARRLMASATQPSALVAARTDGWIELPCPDLERLRQEDPPLAWVQEMRRSVRQYAAEPITVRQLGEFLYRTARVGEPLPGVLHALEIYPVIEACRNLDPGMYYYDPLHHRLAQLCERTPDVDEMLRDARQSAEIVGQALQVLLVLAARPCASVSYALLLQQVGTVFQSMYLVATAMGLAPCALGCGNSDAFARAAGIDYCAETSIGEFLLGSMP